MMREDVKGSSNLLLRLHLKRINVLISSNVVMKTINSRNLDGLPTTAHARSPLCKCISKLRVTRAMIRSQVMIMMIMIELS